MIWRRKGNCISGYFGAGDGNRTHVRTLGKRAKENASMREAWFVTICPDPENGGTEGLLQSTFASTLSGNCRTSDSGCRQDRLGRDREPCGQGTTAKCGIRRR